MSDINYNVNLTANSKPKEYYCYVCINKSKREFAYVPLDSIIFADGSNAGQLKKLCTNLDKTIKQQQKKLVAFENALNKQALVMEELIKLYPDLAIDLQNIKLKKEIK